MGRVKIMPCLDMKGGRIVKGVQFVDLRDAGDPVVNAKFYEEEGADELAILDIEATLEGRKTRMKWIKDIVAVINIPLKVGGGMSSVHDIEVFFNLGASKISVNTAAARNPELIKKASIRFGSKRIIVAIDEYRKGKMPSGFEVTINGGTTATNIDAVEWAKKCEFLGAGGVASHKH